MGYVWFVYLVGNNVPSTPRRDHLFSVSMERERERETLPSVIPTIDAVRGQRQHRGIRSNLKLRPDDQCGGLVAKKAKAT